MTGLIQLTFALAAAGFLLALVSESFAYQVSRLLEKSFDYVECELAIRAQRHAGRSQTSHTTYDTTYSATSEA